MRTANAQDLAAIDRLINPQEPPERIYGWLDSQLSIARHYGGCTFQGHEYVIDPIRPNPPLVRADVLKREVKEQAALKKSQLAALASYAELAQMGLL